MSTLIAGYQLQLNDIKKDLPKKARQILIDNVKEVLDLLRETQLNEGVDSSGKVIGRYSKATEEYAADPYNTPRKDKIAGQPYNFEWTGGLFDEMYLFFDDMKSFGIFSANEKANYLKSKYSKNADIFDLTEENNELVNQKILMPKLIEWVLSQIKI